MRRRPTACTGLLGVVALTCSAGALADSVGYAEARDIRVQHGKRVVHHHHDWSGQTHASRWEMVSSSADPFTPSNDYAHVELLDAVTGEQLWRVPSPALTLLWVSPDGQFVVGLSNIKLWNPYQLVVWDISGHRVHAEHITASEACLAPSDWAKFVRRHAKAEAILGHQVALVDDLVRIDYRRMGVPSALGKKAFRFLFEHSCPSRYSNAFSESVSNWIFWYDEGRPGIEMHEAEGRVTLSLRDPAGERFTIPLAESRGTAVVQGAATGQRW